MPRPRFDKLDPARRAEILSVAAEQFAEHGFEHASYNGIIERLGLSKGAMYYYFDDKEDLFITALRDALQRIIVDVGSLQFAKNADEFWEEVRRWYEKSFSLLAEQPEDLGLIRSLMKRVEHGSGNVALAELRRFGRHHVDQFIVRGQRLGAIRDDLPNGLLSTVLMALEESIDFWLLDHVDDFAPGHVAEIADTLTALYRRVAEPDSDIGSRANPKSKKRKASA